MAKRFMILLTAIAALAFAIPSVASAGLTEGGSLVPVGTTVVSTGSNVTLTSNLLGSIKCEKLNFTSTVNVDNSSEAEASAKEQVPTQSGCLNGTKAVKFTIIIIPHLTWRPPFVRFTFQFKIDIGELACTFTGSEVSGNYTSGTNTYTFSNASGVTGAPSSCGTAKLSGTFALETSSGTAVTID